MLCCLQRGFGALCRQGVRGGVGAITELCSRNSREIWRDSEIFQGGMYKHGCVRMMIWLHTNMKGSNSVGQGGSVVGGER